MFCIFLRVRDALYDVDPVGTTSRWATVVKANAVFCTQSKFSMAQ